MKIPFLFSTNSVKEYYFGLLLKEKKGIGYIISGDGKKLHLVSKKEFVYSDGFEHLTEDVDEILFKLENETKCRVEKTIFFLYSHLVDDKAKEIKKPLLQKIKELTKNIEIKPIGYIECYEAVASFLQSKEGMPLTSILIELDDNNVDVFVYKGGHKMHSAVVSRTDNIIDDLHAVFDVVGQNTLLPNRLLLYDSSHLVDESTKIISHKWSPELFVQLPRVEILKEEQIFEGLLQVFEGQIYQQVTEREKTQADTPTEVMGFIIGQDVGTQQKSGPVLSSTLPDVAKQSLSVIILNKIQQVKAQIKIFHPNNIIHKNFLLPFIIVLFFVCISISGEYFFHKATITVFFPLSSLVKDIAVQGVVEGGKTDALVLHIATSSAVMKDVRATTGKKDIGEKAKGEVTLYNFDDKDKVFAKGTIIQVDNLQFTLDSDVSVSSSTLASDGSAKLPGKSKITVTGVDIGPESNLDKGKRFTVADLSSSMYFAMNDNGFTGGTRKSIRTVSKKDMDDLKASLLQLAKDQQKEQIYKTKTQQATLIDDLINFTLSEVVYSKELGEEGDSLTLQARVLVSYYYFDTQDLNNLIALKLAPEITPGYQLEEKNIHFKINSSQLNKSDITLHISIDAHATKKVDIAQMLNGLQFKSVSASQDFLKAKFQASSGTVQITPSFPLINNFTPLFKKNIVIHIESL